MLLGGTAAVKHYVLAHWARVQGNLPPTRIHGYGTRSEGECYDMCLKLELLTSLAADDLRATKLELYRIDSCSDPRLLQTLGKQASQAPGTSSAKFAGKIPKIQCRNCGTMSGRLNFGGSVLKG